MLLVHKIELDPNRTQSTYFFKACGVARFAYNWALAEWKKQFEQGQKPKEASLRKQLNGIKATEFPWMFEVTKVAPQQAIKNLGQAFNRFFKGLGQYPTFKKKGIHDAFRADNGPVDEHQDAVCIQNKKLQLPKIGWVRLKEKLRFVGRIKSVVISRKADRWYAAISVETDVSPHERKNHGSVGVDVGVSDFAVLSTGEKIQGPKAYQQKLSTLRRLSRSMSRKVRSSENFKKMKRKLSKLHARISNIRSDALHKLSTFLVLNFDRIAIEDLNVSGMQRNRKLSRHIMDQGFYEFRRQLNYKSSWYGAVLTVADRFFPSSRRCHRCGKKNEALTLKDRHWVCACGMLHDRDINAAKNLNQLNTVSSTEIDACEEEGSGQKRNRLTKPCLAEAGIQHQT